MAVPLEDATNVAVILTEQHEPLSAGAMMRLRLLPARKPRAWNTTVRPATAEAGPRTVGTPSAACVHAAKTAATTPAADAAKTLRTTASVA